MRLLLDTHALLWWAHEPDRLSKLALDAISDGENDILVSAVSAMEIATKSRKERLAYQSPLADRFSMTVAEFGFVELAIQWDHAARAGSLPGEHNDPWDRLLAAQSQVEGVLLVSRDKRMADWNIRTLW